MKITTRTLSLLSVLFIVSSCVKPPENMNLAESIREVDGLLLAEKMDVPINRGKITVVMYTNEAGEEDTLAVTDVPMIISIPKNGESKAVNNRIDIRYNEYDQMPDFVPGTGVSEEEQVLMFEDTRIGDYDYNDVILFVKHRLVIADGKYSFDVYVKPIALGCTKQLSFGYRDNSKDNYHVTLAHDVRNDMFANKQGFLNTVENSQFVAPIEAIGDPDEQISSNMTIVTANKTSGKKGLPIVGGYYVYSQNPTKITSDKGVCCDLTYFIIPTYENKPFYVASVDDKVDNRLPLGLAIPVKNSKLTTYSFENQPIWMTFDRYTKWIESPANNHDWYKKGDAKYGYEIPYEALFRWKDSRK